MLAVPSVIRVADLQRQDFLTQDVRERQIDAVLLPRRSASIAERLQKTPVRTVVAGLPALVSRFRRHRMQATPQLGG